MNLKSIFANKVFKNFSYLTIASIFGQLLSLVAIQQLTTVIKPEHYGIYTYLISQGLLLVRISSFGNNNIVIRKISRNISLSKSIGLSTLIYRLLIIFVSSLLYLVYDYFFGQLTNTQLMLIILFTVISSSSFIFEWVFTGQQKLKAVAIINFCTNLSWLLFVIFLVDGTSDPTDIFFLYALSQFIKLVLYAIMAIVNRVFVAQQFKALFKLGFSINKESWPYFAMILLLLPLSSLDNNFLDLNSTNIEKGYFNLAKRLIGPLSLMNTMLITAIFPNIASMWASNKEKFVTIMTKGFPIFILLGTFICFGFSLFCEEVVMLIFDDEYLPAVVVCQIQVWYFLFFSIDFLMGTFLGASDREKTILKFAVIYCCICAPSMYVGSYYGAVGISVALLVSFIIAMAITWQLFKKVMQTRMKDCNGSFLITVILLVLSLVITQVYPVHFVLKVILFLGIGAIMGDKSMKTIKALKI